MTYKEKLTELLKEAPEVKEDLEANEKCLGGVREDYPDWGDWDLEMCIPILEERHLRIYVDNKRIAIMGSGEIILVGGRVDGGALDIAKLDNTKSFDNQEESVYECVYNFLIENKDD